LNESVDIKIVVTIRSVKGCSENEIQSCN
jgi:hypothetical protein